MNSTQFYQYIDSRLANLASFYGIKNLVKYYSLTDFQTREISSLSGVPQAFAQFVLHAQNGTKIMEIVRFFDNFGFLKKKLFGFEPKTFLSKYGYQDEGDRKAAVTKIVNALRYSASNPQGLRWSTNKSKKPDSKVSVFANSLIDGAIYFSAFTSRKEIFNDLSSHYVNGDYKALIKYVMRKFAHGFRVALSCDFLKEFDTKFDLPKPDKHLVDVLAKFKGKEPDCYKGTDKKAFEFIQDFLNLVNDIKKTDPTITAYKLDRQIWLCCTGKFFLDQRSNGNLKAGFLAGIN